MIIVIMAASADNDTKANAREEVIISSIKELGYDSLKPKQLSLCQAKMSLCGACPLAARR